MSKRVQNMLLAGFFLLMIIATFLFAASGNDGVFAPLLLGDLIFLSLWLFRPGKGEPKQAFHAIIAFGIFSVLLSVALSLLGPLYGQQWGWEAHPDDQNGILYPLVNDGRENCFFVSLLYIIYLTIAATKKLFGRKPAVSRA